MLKLKLILSVFVLLISCYGIYMYRFDWQQIHRNNRITFFCKNPIPDDAIVFIGDSQIELFNIEKLIQPFVKVPLSNRGISGEKLAELEDRLPEIIEAQPRSIYLQIGVNDLLAGNKSEEVFKVYKDILVILNRKSELNVISLFPLGEKKMLSNTVIANFNRNLEEFCLLKNIGFVPVFQELLNSKGFLNEEYSADGLHLNNKGNELLATRFKSDFK